MEGATECNMPEPIAYEPTKFKSGQSRAEVTVAIALGNCGERLIRVYTFDWISVATVTIHKPRPVWLLEYIAAILSPICAYYM